MKNNSEQSKKKSRSRSPSKKSKKQNEDVQIMDFDQAQPPRDDTSMNSAGSSHLSGTSWTLNKGVNDEEALRHFK